MTGDNGGEKETQLAILQRAIMQHTRVSNPRSTTLPVVFVREGHYRREGITITEQAVHADINNTVSWSWRR